MTRRQQVVVPNVGTCDLLELDELEGFAFRNGLDLTYPEGDGWVTTRLGSHRWAGWFPGQATRMPEASHR